MRRTDRNFRNARQEKWIGIMCFGIVTGIIFGILVHKYFTPLVAEAEVVAPAPVEVVVQLEVVYNWDKERINKEIEEKAKEYKVSADLMKRIINCESQGSTTIQSNHRYHAGNVPVGSKVGDRELSFGLAQWHIPAKNTDSKGKIITKEMALDPSQALDAMAYHISIGNTKKWSCYSKGMI